MYLLDIKTDTAPADNFTKYQSLDELIVEMKTDREDVNAGKPKIEPEPEAEQAKETIPDIEPIAEIKPDINIPKPPVISDKLRRFEALFVAKTLNKGVGITCSLIADEDIELFLCDAEDLAELCEYIYEWRKLSDEVLPPWLQLVVSACLIFFPKFKEAFSIRKEKKKIVQLETKQDELLKIINDLKEQSIASKKTLQEFELKNIELQSKIKPDPKPEPKTEVKPETADAKND